MERQTTPRFFEDLDVIESLNCAHTVPSSVQRSNVVEAVNTLCFAFEGEARNQHL
jgi:hypothetical protein